MQNKLKSQKSPYLQQHKNNPVNWSPWSEEPFIAAKKENKPVLISIGYSSCHWCHVMAHECFEDKEAAQVLNDMFIPIKIDREEYPDIDSSYMEFTTANFGYGGWPLNVFVNCNKAPFYSVTYLPKFTFIKTLREIHKQYSKNNIIQNQKIINNFKIKKINENEAERIVKSIPPVLGLNGDSHKFPQAAYLLFLLNRNFIEIELELKNIIAKGLFDHIEGGFFRYTVDSEWRIPHFEKMLCDQATILFLLSEAYLKHKNKIYSHTILKTISWLEKNMKLPSGLYGSATNADTKDGEGFYYSINKTDDKNAIRLFDLENCGVHEERYVPWINFEYYLNHIEESENIISNFAEKRKRLEKPLLDAKSVMSWNSFLGFSMLKCAASLDNENIKKTAFNLFENITKYHIEKNNNRFYHALYGKNGFESQEYLGDYAAYLLLLSELDKEKIFRKKIFPIYEEVINKIKMKFIIDNNLKHTADVIFDNFSLWQDSPFPSGGSMLLNALINLGSEEIEDIIPLSSGIVEVAKASPSFFGFWLYGFDRYFY